MTEVQREAVLKGFTIKPPAHSSKDATIELTVKSTDTNSATGTDTKTVTSSDVSSLAVKVTVKPVAESADTNSDGANGVDVTLTAGHVYTKSGEEDLPFDLGVDSGFKLSAGWSNEDGKWVFNDAENKWEDVTSTDVSGRSENTFALLTPYMTKDNDARPDAATDGTLDGSVFTYSDGTTTFTIPFAGEPVKIPMQYLDSVQFKGPKDWAGVVKIQVQAGTVDYDEDAPNTATGMTISGKAWLTNLVIAPKADQVTLKVDAIITTLEDKKTTLKINPTSTDESETFNVTIKGITLGSKILYKGFTYTAEGESPTGLTKEVDGTYTLKIVNFDKTQQPELTPPKDSNATIKLTVTAETVDTLTYIDSAGATQTIIATDSSKNQTLPIEVKVQGVPDEPSLVLVQDKIYTEDAGDQTTGQLKVDLKDLITSFKSGETGGPGGGPDGSETVTLRLSDLPEGFTLEGAGPSLGGSGLTRVWVISESDLADVKIIVPKHYSGTVDFTAQPVVTENDNPSEVFFNKQNIKFAITPVPEATLSISSVLVEDTIGELQLAAVGSDPDEYISAVHIAVTDVEAAGITLYDANGVALTASGGVYTITNTGTTGAPSVFVKGPANFSGSKTLQIAYEVTDPMTSGAGTAVAEWKTAIEHTLNFGAVTDEIDLALGAITGADTASGVTTVTSASTVKVGLNITQKADTNAGGAQDADGSEKFIHVVASGVPDGVSVKGAVETSSGQWLLTVGGTDGIAFNTAIVTQDLEFVVSGYAGTFKKEITITTYTQDTNATSIEKDSVKWTLEYENADPDDADLPELTLVGNNIAQTEDNKFALGDVVTGTVATTAPADKPFQITVTVRTTPEDTTEFEGMTRTVIKDENDQQVVLWTATADVPNTAAGQAALDSLLGSINVVTPKDANSNNITGGKFNLDVNVSVHADGISRDAQAKPELEVKPVTDELVITVSNTVVDEGENISLNIGLSSKDDADGGQGAPGAGWTVVGDKVFVHIADGLDGKLYVNGAVNTGSTTVPAGAPSGLTSGKYYEVDVADLGKLEVIPDSGAPFQTGKLDVTAWAPHTENNSPDTDIVVSTGKGSLEIQQTNSGYKATITATGTEADVSGDKSKAIKLDFGADAGLIDPSEVVNSAYISGLPSGFTVYMGADAGNATMANNAGENTWAIPAVGGQLPAYIAVLPPANWSGSLAGLNLTVLSGHAGTDPTATVLPVAFEVTPVANGIEMTPTLSFGEAGQLIDLNLNASMQDPSKASGALNDAHTERTELTLSGFPDGEKVLFYTEAGVGNGNLGGRVVKGASGEYTISGLTQDELDSLKFVHGATSGVQEIDISARTYEVDSSNAQVGDFSTATTGKVNINISATTPTSGNDLFLWDGTAINGFGGEDTVQLRFGDNLGTGDFANLNSIEIINMKGESSGANSITGLTAADVLDMVGAGNTLTILGDSNDTVDFSAGTDWKYSGSVKN